MVHPPASSFDCVVVASSMGGPDALHKIIHDMCAATRLPILIVQHMPKDFTHRFALSLNNRCAGVNNFTINEAVNNQMIKERNVYIAPGDSHMSVQGKYITLDSHLAKENGCRPAADVLFRSAARTFKHRLLGIVLTGMGQDGTKGARAIKALGGHIIAQDQASSAIWGMPKNVVMAGLADYIVPLQQIPAAIHRLTESLNRH